MKHTPAPWRVFGEKSNIVITAAFLNGSDSYGMPIAYMQTEGNCKDSPGNAQLISAAPELLAACKLAVRYVAKMVADEVNTALPAEIALKRIEQAIKKAEE